MGFKLNRLLPTEPYVRRRLNWCDWLLIAVASINTVRSLIHMIASDGGARTIAGISIDVAGGDNIVSIFAQWGASQLVLVIVYWVVIAKYRALSPLVWLVIFIEQLLRAIAGEMKPIQIDESPPGAYWTYVLLILSLLVLVYSLWDRDNLPDPDVNPVR